MSESEEILSHLLSKGAKLDIEDFYGITPQFLFDKMKNEKLFRESCLKGDLNTIKELMKTGINMLSQDQVLMNFIFFFKLFITPFKNRMEKQDGILHLKINNKLLLNF